MKFYQSGLNEGTTADGKKVLLEESWCSKEGTRRRKGGKLKWSCWVQIHDRTTLSRSGTGRSGRLGPAKSQALPDPASTSANQSHLYTQPARVSSPPAASWGRYRRRGSTFAVSPEKASDGFSIMARSDHGGPTLLPQMPMRPFVVRCAACVELQRCRGGNSGMTRSNDCST